MPQLFTLLALIYGIASAIKKRWIADDAFISFRYAKNLVRGLGLVFNEGEFVEGYTNFLWTIYISSGLAANIDPLLTSQVGGILAYTGSLWVMILFSRKLSSTYQHTNSLFFFPAAACAFALHLHGQLFATGGLETSLFTFLLLAGSYLIFNKENQSGILLGFVALALAAMTRPDGLLFYALAGLFLVLRKSDYKMIHPGSGNFKKIINYKDILNNVIVHTPFLFLFMPYWIWRFNYYGWAFPNTYYAKSGYDSYWSQGLKYFYLYFSSYYILWACMLVLAVFIIILKITKKTNSKKNSNTQSINLFLDLVFLLLLPTVISLTYYVKMGGGFMFARFLIPITPFIYLLLEGSGRFWMRDQIPLARYLRGSFFALLVLGTILRFDPYQGHPWPIRYGVVEEHRVYPPDQMQFIRNLGLQWQPYFQKGGLRIAIWGSQAQFAYYADPPYVLEAATGLTDEYLAHKEPHKRGFIGHEKGADLDYLKQKKIHLSRTSDNLPPTPDYARVKIDGVPGLFRIITYEKHAMDALQKIPGLRMVSFPEYLDNYIANMPSFSRSKIWQDYQDFKEYYFKWNDDPGREKNFLRISNTK